MYTILIFEENKNYSDILTQYLECVGYITIIVKNFDIFTKSLSKNHYDLCMIGSVPKGITIYQMIELVNVRHRLPIIVMCDLENKVEVVKAHLSGAKICLEKDMPLELIEKVCHNIINTQLIPATPVESNIIESGGVKVDFNKRTVYVHDHYIELTYKEFEILLLFIKSVGKAFTREMIIDKVWYDDQEILTRVVDMHIMNIRKKLGVKYLKSVRGYGYKWSVK